MCRFKWDMSLSGGGGVWGGGAPEFKLEELSEL